MVNDWNRLERHAISGESAGSLGGAQNGGQTDTSRRRKPPITSERLVLV